MADRYGRTKRPGEFSIYGFGVTQIDDPGPADTWLVRRTEIDCRAVTPTGGQYETQIGVKVTEARTRNSRSMYGHLVLKPADAEALALRLAPQLKLALDALHRIAVTGDLHDATATAGEALREIEQTRKGE